MPVSASASSGASSWASSGASSWVLHVDLDQFIAAVEVLRRPELAGLPVVVGGAGDPTRRAVVATASYAAREHGVRSGMPLRTAARRCPDAVFLPADNAHYEAVSVEVMDALRALPDAVVEVLGWDEAFVGARTDDPEELAREVQRRVLERTRLHCSVGIGDNLLRAKLATDFGKPAGVFRLTAANWEEVMADRPTRALWGIGPRTAAKLAERGLHTVRELAAADPAALAADLGPALGPWYVQLARGIGRVSVEGTPWVPRSHGRERTFEQDLTAWPDVRTEVAALAAQVAREVAREGRPAARIAVTVRYAPFTTRTRSTTLDAPTSDPALIAAAAQEVLERFAPEDPDHPEDPGGPGGPDRPGRRGRPVRLLGVRAEFGPR